MSIKAVIFDMDGTLINSDPIWKQSEFEYLNQMGYSITFKEIDDRTGVHVGAIVQYALDTYGNQGHTHQELVDGLTNYAVTKILHDKPLMPYAKETLEFLHRKGIKLAIASASPRFMLEEIVKSCGISAYFDYISSATELSHNKPHPIVYLNAAEKLGLSPKECLAVEDSLVGLIAAKAANMRTVIIPASDAYDDPRWLIAETKLHHLAEIQQLNFD